MGFKQWPSVFAKITPVIYQLKFFKRVWCKRTLSHGVSIALGDFSHFEYFIKLKEQFMY